LGTADSAEKAVQESSPSEQKEETDSMSSRWKLALAALALAPAAALGFEAVDTLPFPSTGAFPAYPLERTYPTRIWAQAGLMYDSNAFRLSDSTDAQAVLGESQRDDFVMRYGAGIDYTARVVGRQSVHLGARAEYFDYINYSVLDGAAYGLVGEWLWEFTNDWRGVLGYERSYDPADPGSTQRPVKDVITEDRFYATAIYRFAPNWRATAGADAVRGQRTGDRDDVDTRARSLRLGIDYVTPLANAVGVEWRETRGDAPVTTTGDFFDNEFTETELALLVTYNVGAQLRLAGRLGHTRHTYSELPVEPFDDTTWRGALTWLPEAKLNFVAEASREPRAVLDVDATHVVVTTFGFGPNWAPTAKLVFTVRLARERQQYQSTETSALIARDETRRLLRFGAGWEPVRRIRVGAGLDIGERTANTLGRDYDYYAVMGNVRYDW
jgi:hypothetical protein